MIKAGLGSETAIVLEEKTYSYSQLYQSIHDFADILLETQAKRVALFAENSPDWIIAFFAAWKVGATVVPIDYMSSAADVEYILTDSQPDVVFTSKQTQSTFHDAVEDIQLRPINFELENFNPPLASASTTEGFSFTSNNQSTAVIIYTSGTTSHPKGVMLSFDNLEANIRAVTIDVPIFKKGLEVLLFLPLHHIFPLAGSMLAPLSVGGCVVLSPSMEADAIRTTLKNNKIAVIIGVPRFYDLIYRSIKSQIEHSLAARTLYKLAYRLQSQKFSQKVFKKVHLALGGHIQNLVSGGAALPTEVGTFYKTLGFTILEGYGMTETAPMITFPRPGTERIGTTGQLLPGVEMKFIDHEIVVKGPNVMQGYLNKPDATNEVLKDGWLYTGDLGEMDSDGYLKITGRKKEIIVLDNGKNISPVELEEKLKSRFEQVKDAAVFMHDGQIHAAILPNWSVLSGNEVAELNGLFRNEVFSVFNAEVASYKQIKQFTLLRDELPKTRLGKVKRFLLPQLIVQSEEKIRPVPEQQSDEFKQLASFIKEQTGKAIYPTDHLEFDVALDSLGKLFLIDFIFQSYGLKLKLEQLQEFGSMANLAQYIGDAKHFSKVSEINWSQALKYQQKLKLPQSWLTLPLISKCSRSVFWFMFRFRGVGVKNLPKGPVILAPNHQSFFDGLFVLSLLKSRTMRSTYFYAKQKHVQHWFLRFMASKHNVIVIDLQKDLKESIQKLAMVLRSGKNIIIFPEGTRTTNGSLGDFKKTFAILSKELNVPVVPIAISGAYDAFSTTRYFPRIAAPIHVNFLQAIYPDGFSYDDLTQKVRSEIQKVLENMKVKK